MTTTKMTNPNQNSGQLSASFRDPSGFLFSRDGILYRQVNRKYEQEYTRLMESGLYDKLVKAGLLIPHIEGIRLWLRRKRIRSSSRNAPRLFLSREWSFGQLSIARDAVDPAACFEAGDA
jgi:hypothetical protein